MISGRERQTDMRLFKDNSIKQKLIRISLFTAGLALVLSALVLTINEVIVFKKSLLNELSTQTEIVGNNCTAALTFNDAKTATEILSALKANRNINRASIYTKDGTLFADYSSEVKMADVSNRLQKAGYRFGLNYAEIYHDIVLEHEVIGSIYIHSNLNALYADLSRHAGVFLAAILISLMVVYVLSSGLQKAITEPISDLVRTMKIISAEKDYSVRAAVQSRDELGALSEGFNEMLIQIQARDSELSAYRASLEGLVDKRTIELKISNAQIQRELTEREKAEEAFHALTLQYEAILAAVPDIIMKVDSNKVYTWANKAGYKFFGDDVIGKAAAFYFEGEQQTYDKVRPLFNGSEDVIYTESWQRRKDGEKRLLAWWCRVLKDSGGSVTGALSTARDITEHNKMEEALKKSEEFNRNILETVDEGFIVIDPEFRIISVNKAYLRMLNKTEEEVKGEYCYKLSHRLCRPCCEVGENCAVNITLKTGTPQTATHTHYDESGRPIFVELKSFPIRDSSGKVVAAIEVINNISERRRLEDQLRHAQKMEAVGTLAGGIAHDFNNILNVILGYGAMVMEKLQDDRPEKGQMKEVLAAGERAADLTKRLLLFSRKESPEFKPIDVNEMVINIEKMLVRIIGEDIKLITDLTGKKAMVMADASQMEQVLMNLATNARDAMPKGGRLTINTELGELDAGFIKSSECAVPGSHAVISITDTGTGIDSEKQARIFDPFFTTKEVGKGTGLGLSIAYGIIKQHNGYIKVYSETGRGTTFKIWLPVVEYTAEKITEVEVLTSLNGGSESILVAEDDAALRRLTSTVLEAFGYRVITAEDGEDAVTKFMKNRDSIQLVVLDMIMPNKNGKEAYEEISAMQPDIKVLFMSGYTEDVIQRKKIIEGKLPFLQKPVKPRELLAKIREVLDKKQG